MFEFVDAINDIRSENAEESGRYRTLAVPSPATPTIVRRRNEIAHLRGLISERLKGIELEERMLQQERKRLQKAFDRTCEEWDRVWMRGAP